MRVLSLSLISGMACTMRLQELLSLMCPHPLPGQLRGEGGGGREGASSMGAPHTARGCGSLASGRSPSLEPQLDRLQIRRSCPSIVWFISAVFRAVPPPRAHGCDTGGSSGDGPAA